MKKTKENLPNVFIAPMLQKKDSNEKLCTFVIVPGYESLGRMPIVTESMEETLILANILQKTDKEIQKISLCHMLPVEAMAISVKEKNPAGPFASISFPDGEYTVFFPEDYDINIGEVDIEKATERIDLLKLPTLPFSDYIKKVTKDVEEEKIPEKCYSAAERYLSHYLSLSEEMGQVKDYRKSFRRFLQKGGSYSLGLAMESLLKTSDIFLIIDDRAQKDDISFWDVLAGAIENPEKYGVEWEFHIAEGEKLSMSKTSFLVATEALLRFDKRIDDFTEEDALSFLFIIKYMCPLEIYVRLLVEFFTEYAVENVLGYSMEELLQKIAEHPKEKRSDS